MDKRRKLDQVLAELRQTQPQQPVLFNINNDYMLMRYRGTTSHGRNHTIKGESISFPYAQALGLYLPSAAPRALLQFSADERMLPDVELIPGKEAIVSLAYDMLPREYCEKVIIPFIDQEPSSYTIPEGREIDQVDAGWWASRGPKTRLRNGLKRFAEYAGRHNDDTLLYVGSDAQAVLMHAGDRKKALVHEAISKESPVLELNYVDMGAFILPQAKYHRNTVELEKVPQVITADITEALKHINSVPAFKLFSDAVEAYIREG